jgi:hypothetical protein
MHGRSESIVPSGGQFFSGCPARRTVSLSSSSASASESIVPSLRQWSPPGLRTFSKHNILEDAGIPKQRAAEWERLSDVPHDEFETALATKSARVGAGRSPPN